MGLTPKDSMDMQFSDFLSDLVARFDPQRRHTYVNSAVELFTGLPAKEFLGKTNQELGMPEELVSQWDRTLDQVFRTGNPSDITFTFMTSDGLKTFNSTIVPERDSNGKVISVISFAREVIGEKFQVPDRAFTESDLARYRAIVECSEDAIIGKTLEGQVTSWNPAAERMFGFTANEMIGHPITRIFPPDRVFEEALILERLCLGERVSHFETIRTHKDGRAVYVSVSSSPIRDSNGDIVGASKIARDVTPLKVERERLQLALDASSSGLWDWDLLTGVVYRSDAFLKLCGYEREDDTKDIAFFERIVHSDDLKIATKAIEDYRLQRVPVMEFEFRLRTKIGYQGAWMLCRGRAIDADASGAPTRIVGTITDITHSINLHAELQDREKRLARVIEGSDQGYWDWNIQSNSLTVSSRWASMLGFQLEELDVENGKFSQYVHPEDFSYVMKLAQEHIAGTRTHLDAEIRCFTKHGDWKWIQTRGRIVERDSAGAPLMMSGTHTDITERKALELIQKDATTVFENSYEGIMVVGSNGLISRVNPAFTRISGYNEQEVIGQSPKILSSGRQNAAFYRDMYHSLKVHRYWSGEIWNRRKNGEIFAELLSISAVVDASGQLLHYIGIFSDISQLKAHEAELDRIAHYDPLTGAPNRRLLADRMQQSIARADRHQQSLAVCYLDLDGFKEINDHFGHAVGDRLLVEVANDLRLVLRTDDTLSRLGGDEFVILLDTVSSPEECSLILERLLNAIGSPRQIDDHKVVVSASIGVSLYPLDHSDADTLLRHADNAMYQAKQRGKNRYILFDPDSDHKAQEHRSFLARVHEALERDEFRLFYQPKADLESGTIIGVEALIRWQNPEQGLLSPAAFLPQIEGSTVDLLVGKWVIDSALTQAAQWIAMGVVLNISVNISANHLMREEFISDLKAALYRHPTVHAEQMELEVLETVAISDMTKTIEVLNECRKLGFRLALDDFGTGYSSLTYLRKLPIDTLKIDQSFVSNMLQDAEDRDIVEGVISLAGAFNRSVIAEGVETLEHGVALQKMGCHLVQGYGIARPMPAMDLLPWQEIWEKSYRRRELI